MDLRSIVRPLFVRFLELFRRLFSKSRNSEFIAALTAAFNRKQVLHPAHHG